jgi:hypothetical protein
MFISLINTEREKFIHKAEANFGIVSFQNFYMFIDYCWTNVYFSTTSFSTILPLSFNFLRYFDSLICSLLNNKRNV